MLVFIEYISNVGQQSEFPFFKVRFLDQHSINDLNYIVLKFNVLGKFQELVEFPYILLQEGLTHQIVLNLRNGLDNIQALRQQQRIINLILDKPIKFNLHPLIQINNQLSQQRLVHFIQILRNTNTKNIPQYSNLTRQQPLNQYT